MLSSGTSTTYETFLFFLQQKNSISTSLVGLDFYFQTKVQNLNFILISIEKQTAPRESSHNFDLNGLTIGFHQQMNF